MKYGKIYEKGKNRKGEKTDKVNEAIARLLILDLKEKEARAAAKLEIELSRKGQKVNKLDVLIAGIAKENNAKIITADNDFKKIAEIKAIYY